MKKSLFILALTFSALAVNAKPHENAVSGELHAASPVNAALSTNASADQNAAFGEKYRWLGNLYLRSNNDLKFLDLDIEAKIGEFFGNSCKCTNRRAKALTKSYRNYVSALKSRDPAKIIAAAKVHHNNAYTRSSMFTKCWNKMAENANSAEFRASIEILKLIVAAA